MRLSRQLKLSWRLFIDMIEYRVEYIFEDWSYVQDLVLLNGDVIFDSGKRSQGIHRPFSVDFMLHGRKCLVFVYRDDPFMTADLYCDDVLLKEGQPNFIHFRDQEAE